MKTRFSILICLMALLPALTVGSQEVSNADNTDKFFFNHLSIGGSLGTTGIGVVVATPINKNFTLRGEIDVMPLGTLKLKLANTMTGIYDFMGVTDESLQKSAETRKVEVGMNITSITGKLLVDYYPVKESKFHVTAGLIFGNRNIAHIFNTVDGNMMFSAISNYYISEYNKYFHTSYPEVGLRFGDYVFTADDNGNLDARMLVNAVRPYVGIGWGRSIDAYHSCKKKVRTNVDLGFEYWGTPQFKLNNGEKLVKTDNDSDKGILGFFSGFWAYPTIKLTLCGDLF